MIKHNQTLKASRSLRANGTLWKTLILGNSLGKASFLYMHTHLPQEKQGFKPESHSLKISLFCQDQKVDYWRDPEPARGHTDGYFRDTSNWTTGNWVFGYHQYNRLEFIFLMVLRARCWLLSQRSKVEPKQEVQKFYLSLWWAENSSGVSVKRR